MNIGFIGLGDMGQLLASNLLRNLPETTLGVYNRTKSKTDGLVKDGAIWYDSPKTLADASDLVFLMVTDDQASEDIIFNHEFALTHATPSADAFVIVNMSTITPDTSISIAKRLKEEHSSWNYVEAPVSGTLPHAKNAELIILTAGNEGIISDLLAVFEVLGRRMDYIGALGSALRMKLLINGVLAVQTGILAEAFQLAEQNGLSAAQLSEIVNDSALGNVVSKAKGKMMLDKSYPTLFRYQYIVKDLQYAMQSFANEQISTSAPLLQSTLELYQKGMKALQPEGTTDINSDFSAIREVYARLNSE